MKTKDKKRWQGFEITRIKLEPEQAVMVTCDGGSKPSRSWPGCSNCGDPAGGGSYSTGT